MHPSPATHNPPPDALAALARMPRGKHQPAGVLADRDRAILAAMEGGHATGAVADATGLTPRTIERIASGRSRVRGGGAASAPRVSRIDRALPKLGSVLFDQAGAPALATLDIKTSECHWPFGEGETFRFCGAPATVGYRRGALTYCARCAGEAFASRARSSELSMKAA